MVCTIVSVNLTALDCVDLFKTSTYAVLLFHVYRPKIVEMPHYTLEICIRAGNNLLVTDGKCVEFVHNR